MTVRVGFGKASLWGSWRPEMELADSVEVNSFAVDDERSGVALLLVADVCGMWPSTCEHLRAVVAQRAGTTADRIGVFCTQNHGAPMEGPGVYDIGRWEMQFVAAAEQAVRSLEPCTMAMVETAPSPSGVVRRRVRLGETGCFSFFFGFEVEPDGRARCAKLLDLALRGLCSGPEITVRHPLGGEEARWPACGMQLPSVPRDTWFEAGTDGLMQGIFFRTPDGKPIGSLSRWAAHPVTANAFGSSVPAGYGGDYPLYIRERLSQEFGGGAVFLTGPCGDQAPLVAERSRVLAERTGSRVAGILLEALESARWTEPDGYDARSEIVRLPVRPDYPKSVEHARAELGAARARLGDARKARTGLGTLKALSEEIERLSYTVDGSHHSWCGIAPEDLVAGVVSHPLTCLRVGDALIAGLPGEPFGRYSIEIRRRIASRGTRKIQVLVAEECNGYLSYIPTADEFTLGGYGPAAAVFAPECERTLVEATVSLARRCGA